MNKNERNVWVAAILAGFIVVVFVIVVVRDPALLRPQAKTISCNDGPRLTIDVDDFDVKYWAYSYEFQANAGNRGTLGGKIEPAQLQKVSEALQDAIEYRKLLIHSYNACAITKNEFESDATRFETLDNLSRQISTLANLTSPTPADVARLKSLVDEYIRESQQLATKK